MSRPSPSIPRPSRRLMAAFRLYLRWYMGRAFHAVRVAHGERFPALGPDSRTIVCVNHPSWWDPLVCMVMARRFAPRADHYGPMEANALEHYGFMRNLGLFPLDKQSPLAGAQFLRASSEVLQRPNSLLWIMPEGAFTDVRDRPSAWRPGVATLVAQQTACTVIPIALEYTFWDERLPEALALIGEPIVVENGRAARAAHWQAVLSTAMTRAQNELAALSMARNAAPFDTLIRGGSGVALFYNLWHRMQALRRGRPYAAEHGHIPHA